MRLFHGKEESRMSYETRWTEINWWKCTPINGVGLDETRRTWREENYKREREKREREREKREREEGNVTWTTWSCNQVQKRKKLLQGSISRHQVLASCLWFSQLTTNSLWFEKYEGGTSCDFCSSSFFDFNPRLLITPVSVFQSLEAIHFTCDL